MGSFGASRGIGLGVRRSTVGAAEARLWMGYGF